LGREFCGSFPPEQRTSSRPKKTETVLSGFKSSDTRTSMKRFVFKTISKRRRPMKRMLSALLTLAVFATLAIVATTSKRAVPAVHAQSGCSRDAGDGDFDGTSFYAVS